MMEHRPADDLALPSDESERRPKPAVGLIARLQRFSQGQTLGDVTVQELRDTGRR